MVTFAEGDPEEPPSAEVYIPPEELPPVEMDEGEPGGEEGKGGLVLLIGLVLLGGMAVWGMRR